VRFDGGHKRDASLIEAFAPIVEWVRVCPEVEVGMGVPREPVRLVKVGADVRMIAVQSGIDHTDDMRAWAARRVTALATMDLRGYVLKKDSPSCGMEGVKVHGEGGEPSRTGVGIFAAVLRDAFPDLPIEEEARLSDAAVRAAFLERVFAYDRHRETRTSAAIHDV
jgi:uncharacterized protein YbbK (DUF523 family)